MVVVACQHEFYQRTSFVNVNSRNSPPSHHYSGQPNRRFESFQQKVARYFKSRITEEENCRAQAVLGSREVEVVFHAGDFGVSDVSAVEEGQKVQQGQHGDQAQVHLTECLAWIDVGDVDSISRPAWVVMFGIGLFKLMEETTKLVSCVSV